jgi:hypothetical protein
MSDDEGAAELGGGPDPAIGGDLVGPAVSMDAMRQDFLDFFDAEYHLVVRFMMRNGASLGAAEDSAQEAFVRSWLERKWVCQKDCAGVIDENVLAGHGGGLGHGGGQR